MSADKMTVEELIEMKEAIQADKSRTAEQRKRDLRILRRKIRKASGHVPQTIKTKERAADQLTAKELLAALVATAKKKGLTNLDMHTEQGYGFSMSTAARQKINDVDIYFGKFKYRWGVDATKFCTYKQGHDVIFVLGPVNK